MLLLVSGATATVRRYRDVGELIVPAAGSAPSSLRLEPQKWAMDNAAYSSFDVALFIRMLRRFHGWPGCLFVTAPDVVGQARETLALWPFWSQMIRGVGFPPALVAQDGLTVAQTPWAEVGALFIGGTTEWKMGPVASELVGYAKARGIWVHVGRINSARRIRHFQRLGVDSFDGGQYSRWANRRIPEGLRDVQHAIRTPGLPF